MEKISVGQISTMGTEVYIASEVDELILRYTEDMKYISGIVERGTGEPIPGNKPIRLAILEYVKDLERLHIYERWADDVYGMVKTIMWASGKMEWSKEKALEDFKHAYERAEKYDALLSDVRRLVDAGKYRDNIDNTCRDGWDIFRAKVDLKEAIAAVERHLEEVTSGR